MYAYFRLCKIIVLVAVMGDNYLQPIKLQAIRIKKNTFIRKIYNHKAMNYNVLVINSLKKSNCLNWF